MISYHGNKTHKAPHRNSNTGGLVRYIACRAWLAIVEHFLIFLLYFRGADAGNVKTMQGDT